MSTREARRSMPLHWKILIGLVLGLAVGVSVHGLGATDALPGWLTSGVKFVGDLFLRLLRLVAIPVILFSLIAAVAGVPEPKMLGRLGGKTLGVFALTAVVSVMIAMGITLIVQPGSSTFVSREAQAALIEVGKADADKRIAISKALADSGGTSVWGQILDVFPSNPFKALADGNMLQVVSFGIVLGLGLLLIDQDRRVRTSAVMSDLAEACLKLVGLIMKLAPVAVFCMTALLFARTGFGLLAGVGVFVACVLGGLGVILFVVYPVAIKVLTPKANRLTMAGFFRGMGPAQLLALSSSSSAATMPVTMACCDRLGVPRRVSSLVVPLGTTINMDGTALYQVLCVTFLAQLYGVELSGLDYVGIGAMAIAVAVGSPGLPGASIVMMVFVLAAFNIPAEGIAIIVAVDRILDMARTVVNVTGDAAASVIVAGSDREDLTETTDAQNDSQTNPQSVSQGGS